MSRAPNTATAIEWGVEAGYPMAVLPPSQVRQALFRRARISAGFGQDRPNNFLAVLRCCLDAKAQDRQEFVCHPRRIVGASDFTRSESSAAAATSSSASLPSAYSTGFHPPSTNEVHMHLFSSPTPGEAP